MRSRSGGRQELPPRIEVLRAEADLSLDVERFDKELTEHVHADRIHEDFMSGVRSGVNGTPTFYLNGIKIPSIRTAHLEEAFLYELRKAGVS